MTSFHTWSNNKNPISQRFLLIDNGIDLYIQENIYKSSPTEFNTKSPLTYTIAMFKLLGYSNADIRKSILSLSDLDLLNCINVFLYIYPAISANFFIYNETSYLITISSSASINKIQIEPRHFYGGNPERLTKEKIDKCIDKAFDYVRK